MANGRGSRPTVCKGCGALAQDGVRISFRSLCPTCGERRMMQTAEQIGAKSGPIYDAWRESMRRLIEAP